MASKEPLLNYQAFERQLFDKLEKWRVVPTLELKAEITADLAKLREIAPATVVARVEAAWTSIPAARDPVPPLTDKERDEFMAIEIIQAEMKPQLCENTGWCICTLACIALAAGAMLGIYYIAGGEHL